MCIRDRFNNDYKDRYEAAGMKCVGINPESVLVEIVEIPALKSFVGTQFHPEYGSTVDVYKRQPFIHVTSFS